MTSSGNIETLTADGKTKVVTVLGPVRVSLTGDFGSGTAQVQVLLPDDGNEVNVALGSFTAVTDTIFDFPERSETDIRVDLSGSTAPALLVWIQGNAPHH